MSGSTAWQFDAKGVIVLTDTSERAQEAAIELGVEDLELDDGVLTVYTNATELFSVAEALEVQGFASELSQLTKLPQTETMLDASDSHKVASFIESLEELDDVQNVYSTAQLNLEAVS